MDQVLKSFSNQLRGNPTARTGCRGNFLKKTSSRPRNALQGLCQESKEYRSEQPAIRSAAAHSRLPFMASGGDTTCERPQKHVKRRSSIKVVPQTKLTVIGISHAIEWLQKYRLKTKRRMLCNSWKLVHLQKDVVYALEHSV
ncbi:hypothetical protein KIN20_012815 [Parelaphostrongylus tenuis]|uniref:Uncharacterized protein n=1 Tax=Parelaphostrongylus tenuis TaxID=148309 RepID=A0AAD5QN22_PARTN|nr:hypothetical protein KIN20_012815 [Parelaphostrongylus tenuis]